jgi:pimeloyl-ACP methyl ester carboxylesterase
VWAAVAAGARLAADLVRVADADANAGDGLFGGRGRPINEQLVQGREDIGGGESSGEGVGNTMKLAADDVQTLVIPGCGHWVAEQAPDQLLAALTTFLAPYRDGPGS